MNLFEGFDSKSDPCNKITNCTQCSNANVGGSNPNEYGGICGWCKKTGTCMSTEQNYYMANQDRCNCSTDARDCNAVGCGNIKPDSDGTHPVLKWYLILNVCLIQRNLQVQIQLIQRNLRNLRIQRNLL